MFHSTKFLLTILGLALILPSLRSQDAATKVLYVTHEPGKWHDYTPQKEAFIALAEKQNWDLTVITGTHEEVENTLATTNDFAVGHDVVVYNICMAKSKKLRAPFNIIKQTEEHGVPALLVHCTLHSFWPTYKGNPKGPAKRFVHPGGDTPAQVKAERSLWKKWKASHPDQKFPVWSEFTGIASTTHGPKLPIDVTQMIDNHGAIKNFREYTTAENAELYNNFITAEEAPAATPILKGSQGESEAIVLWEKENGSSKTLSFTLGHAMDEWKQEEFLSILSDCVSYLAETTR